MTYEECINKVIEFSEKFYNSLDFAHNMEHMMQMRLKYLVLTEW